MTTRTRRGSRRSDSRHRDSRHLGPAERYGHRRRWARPAIVAGTALVAAAGTAWVLWAGLFHADPDVTARLQGYDVVSANEVKVSIALERPADTAVACVLQAQAADHSVVGEREVVVPAGPQTSLTRTFVVTTERPATNGVLDGCRPVEDPAAPVARAGSALVWPGTSRAW